MAKIKENVKDLKNIKSFGYSKLTMWGMAGAAILFIFSIVATIFIAIVDWSVTDAIFHYVGLGLGIAYAIIGVFVLIKVAQKQEGSYWALFMVAGIFAALTPIAYIPGAGIGLSLLAGISFLVYYLLEKK